MGRTKTEYKKGDKLGQLIFIKDAGWKHKPCGMKDRLGLFLCKCGNETIVRIDKAKSNKIQSCGCSHKRINSNNTLIVSKWHQIKQRCYNPLHNKYHLYGGRGITIFGPWINDPNLFVQYVVKLPGYKKYPSLDRINNDGNYEPGNLRWTTFQVQSANRGKQKNNTSGFIGISHNNKGWTARIKINRCKINLGTFDKIEDAVVARNNYIISKGLSQYPIQHI